MKKIFILLVLVFCTSLFAQEKESYVTKVETIDSTIKTLYAVISGEKGEERDWELFQYLFLPDAKLIPTGNNRQGVEGIRYLTIEDYINTSGKWLLENGFFENELHRVTEQFGNIAHVFSTYESFKTANDSIPFMRGINSIQMLYDGNRWWIVNIYWMGEDADHPIPNAYLPRD
ncbi:hypothetical protein ACFQO1_00810 [Jejudonia soesokkakensis]|uniref:SnoaL-like domain-containing protein n=1 Tax=Jejudonia soesokkakensis TaxID=1323432 RepID=A0ABW2MTT6_9FLAO